MAIKKEKKQGPPSDLENTDEPVPEQKSCQTVDHFVQWPTSVLFLFLLLFRAARVAYRGSQARDLIRAVAAGLYHSRSNAGSELRLRPTPGLTAMPDS